MIRVLEDSSTLVLDALVLVFFPLIRNDSDPFLRLRPTCPANFPADAAADMALCLPTFCHSLLTVNKSSSSSSSHSLTVTHATESAHKRESESEGEGERGREES